MKLRKNNVYILRITKAKEILQSNDFGKDNTQIMKTMTAKWKEIGSAGKDENGLYDIDDTYLCVGNIYDDYEKAALSAIEYVLNNFI